MTAAATSVESQATLPGSVAVEEEEVEAEEGLEEDDEEGEQEVVVSQGFFYQECITALLVYGQNKGRPPKTFLHSAVVRVEVKGSDDP